jgi:hypothetical protein
MSRVMLAAHWFGVDPAPNRDRAESAKIPMTPRVYAVSVCFVKQKVNKKERGCNHATMAAARVLGHNRGGAVGGSVDPM